MSGLAAQATDGKGKKTLFGGSEKRQEIFRVENLQTILFSLEALWKSMKHPYVIKKLRICLKPIAMAAGAVYVAGMALLIPFAVLAFTVKVLSLGLIDYHWLMVLGRSWVKESVALVPFFAVLAMKSFLRRPLHRVFMHLLQEVNPQEAARIEAKQPTTGNSDKEAASARNRTALRIVQKAGFILIADALLGRAQKGHFIGGIYTGRVLVALSHFYTTKKILGRDRAVILSFLGIFPYVEVWILKAVHIWRASSLLGQELLSDYLRHGVPSGGRGTFMKSHDVDIPLFALPGSLLLLIPIIGPLFFVPLQASAAFLVDRFEKQGGQTAAQYSKENSTVYTDMAPTLPSGPHPNDLR